MASCGCRDDRKRLRMRLRLTAAARIVAARYSRARATAASISSLLRGYCCVIIRSPDGPCVWRGPARHAQDA
jgi:hypothetical protein